MARPKGMNIGKSYEQRVLVLRTLAAMFFSKHEYTGEELMAGMNRFVVFNSNTRDKVRRAGVLKCTGRIWTLSIPVHKLLTSCDEYAAKMVDCSAQEQYAESRRQAKCQDYRKALRAERERIKQLEARISQLEYELMASKWRARK